ncbi:unnamed protein product [Dovyalis caffra]|uniref:Uncharacterized protein n=1 Tax=Dovyalis caffra TaxID=77055 RepID=A0AAV1RGB9_9ROSI|nr:unnamed protein product [Dovyalis caffra]
MPDRRLLEARPSSSSRVTEFGSPHTSIRFLRPSSSSFSSTYSLMLGPSDSKVESSTHPKSSSTKKYNYSLALHQTCK